ncbi:hypothetical protein EDD86DRAFT_205155 [Gorgonomyces haynaldii]|nr:hypothetical protein EDD86DRAFT_205155 [Gorgonomyces haynaldii]
MGVLETLGIRNADPSSHIPIGERIINVNDTVKNETREFKDNVVSTGKYNAATFLPRFLWEQLLTKYANLFFLCTGVVQLIPDISPTSKYGTLIPLTVILIFTAFKELAEDRKRHRQDYEINHRKTKVLSGSQFVDRQWREVQVGDIVRVENSEYFPADLVILSSSEPDAICYIETSNLDGETNLKIRQGLPETVHLLTPDAVSRMNAVIRSEMPNNSLYTFDATLVMDGKEYPLSPEQLLLRGAQLRNTRWIYAVVVFTGHETKLMKNSTATPIKRTKVEHMINSQILLLFGVLMTISLICSVGAFFRQWSGSFETKIMLNPNSATSATSNFFRNLLTFIILFNNLIPLSLIVTVEFVKYALAFMIDNDLDMYYEVSDSPAQAKTSSLVEELGQIDFIFSDKTGTLTRNIMEFKMASIGGIPYAETVPDDKRLRKQEDGTMFGYYDFKALNQHKNGHSNADCIKEFLTLLAVCHTVIPEHDENDPGKLTYQASSPDEAALVQGAKALGYLFHTRRPRSVTIAVHGSNFEYEILVVNEFNSTRKRMSVLARCPDGKIKLYIKGADTVIFDRLGDNNPFNDATSQHLEEYANEGLRTLCLASRDISEQEYTQWRAIYDQAATSLVDRQQKLDDAAELIEKNLFLLGATAIEDKLQDGVPDAIHTLMEAGIKLWVLTGDRQETAINIGYSCKLIHPGMNLLICNGESHFEVKDFLEKTLIQVKSSMGMGTPTRQGADPSRVHVSIWTRFWRNMKRTDNGKFDKDYGFDAEPMALVIDGKSLTYALEKDCNQIFLELAMLCKAVICCRVSPLQKALVVKLVRKNVAQSVTLAIGDGANDVSMIQAAHVGVGISGQEGLQAARAADFAVAQFRYLRNLLLIHGSWAYARVSKVIVYSFYKNITLYLIQLWFALHNGFSGTTLFETWSEVASYNVVWTLFPPLAIGIFDQFLSARVLDRYPQLYRLGQTDTFYNNAVFLGWVANSFIHSLFIFFIWKAFLGESDIMPNGRVIDNWAWGSMVYATDLVTVLLKACLIVDLWVWVTALFVFGSLGAFFVLFPTYAVVGNLLVVSPELFNVNLPIFTTPSFWLALIIVPVAVNLRDFVWKYYKRSYEPKSYHIAQEIQKFDIPDYRPRTEWFRKAVHKVRQIQRIKRSKGFAFSQNESGQAGLIRQYDTTKRKPKGL